MPKLTEKQRRKLKEDLIKGNKDTTTLSQEYGITNRMAQYYARTLRVANPKGRPNNTKETINIEEQDTMNTEPAEERTLPPLTENTPPELPEEGNLCATCYNQGKITHLEINQAQCNSCGSKLRWSGY